MAATRSALFAVSLSVSAMLAAVGAAVADEPTLQSTHVETDGMLTKKEARRFADASVQRRKSASQSEQASSFWVFDYLSRMLDGTPETKSAARAHRPAIRVAAAKPAAAPAKLAPPIKTAATNPVVTGAITTLMPTLPEPKLPTTKTAMESPESIIVTAERTQARMDLVKLELSSRTYDERKLSGQQVFESRGDWRVLERARDALSGAELISALAAGFEANAYINDETRTIVVAVAGSQDLRRDFLAADVWKALIKAEAPQQFYLAKTYVRSVIQRYQMQGYSTECIGHSLGGGACAYAASELGIRALVLNPISAGRLAQQARYLVTNYVVDGEIAGLVYGARGNETSGDIQKVNDGRDVIRLMALQKYGQLAGPVLVIRELRAGIQSHKVDRALDLVATHAETARPR